MGFHVSLGECNRRETEPRDAFSPSTDSRFGGFPRIKGTLSGVLIIRSIVFWGLYWGPLLLGNYHLTVQSDQQRVTLYP